MKRMLRQMSPKQLRKWMWFAEVEPFNRDTYQLAYIAQLLANVNRDTKKRPEPYPLSDFVLSFEKRVAQGEIAKEVQPAQEREKQSLKTMELHLSTWFATTNAIYAAEEAKRKAKEEAEEKKRKAKEEKRKT